MVTESAAPPLVAPPWTQQWDTSTRSWLFTNTSTGDRTYEYDCNLMHDSSQGNEGTDCVPHHASDAQRSLSPATQSVQTAPESLEYGVGDVVDQVDAYQEEVEGAVATVKDSMAGWVSNAGAGVGRDIEQNLSDVADAPDVAVNAVVEGVENLEQLGEDVGEALADAPETVVEGVGDGVEDVQLSTDDVGSAVAQVPEDVMRKIGECVGDVREVGEGVQRYGGSLGQAYEQGKEEEER